MLTGGWWCVFNFEAVKYKEIADFSFNLLPFNSITIKKPVIAMYGVDDLNKTIKNAIGLG